MTTFKKHFFEAWEAEGQSLSGSDADAQLQLIELCGLVREESNGRVEFQWVPEHPSCPREAVARRVFNTALQKASNDTEAMQQKPFAVIEPLIGHAAVRLFCDKREFWRDIREVAFIKPVFDDHKYIG